MATAAAASSAGDGNGGALPPLLTRPTLVMQIHDVRFWGAGFGSLVLS